MRDNFAPAFFFETLPSCKKASNARTVRFWLMMISSRRPWRSLLYRRLALRDRLRMPPLASSIADPEAIAVFREWIEGLEGMPALEPVEMRIADPDPIHPEVGLAHPIAEAAIFYTVDGSLPGPSAAAYAGPIRVSGSAAVPAPVSVRAKAFRNGYVDSAVASLEVPACSLREASAGRPAPPSWLIGRRLTISPPLVPAAMVATVLLPMISLTLACMLMIVRSGSRKTAAAC